MEITSTSPGTPSSANPVALPVARDLTQTLDILTHQAQAELGNTTQSLFFFGDGLQRAVVDGVFSLFTPHTWAPANILRLGYQGVRQAAQLVQALLPGQAILAWHELRNKLEVFTSVKNLSADLGLPAGEFIPLPQMVGKAYGVSPFLALWAVEGVGHDYTDRYWQHKGVPSGLLSAEQAPVPEKSLLMLHAGMGLSFADRLLGDLTSEATPDQVRSVVEYFLFLCRSNSRPGYMGAALESLGLQTRVFYSDLLHRVDQQLRLTAPEFLGFFWHGAGRGLYFSREYFLPVLRSVWCGVDEEARNTPDRLSSMAGLNWAVTLVNMRQPEIIQNMLRSPIESDLIQGFTNGAVSSVIMREDTTPGEPFTSDFYQNVPDAGQPFLAAEWARLIANPCRVGLQTYYPVLRECDAPDQVFRYQDLSALISNLKARQAGGGN